jgi:ABC-2 type transport system permease protein
MKALSRITLSEIRLLGRDVPAVFFVFALPVLLLVGFGMIPGFSNPDPDLSGQSGTGFIASIGVAIVLSVLGLTVLPGTLASYREKGILRRLATTPVPPGYLLSAQMLVNLIAAVIGVAVIVVMGAALYHLQVPAQSAWFAISVLLGAGSLFGIGWLIAALIRTSKAAQVVGAAVTYPSMFLAGVWVPREALPSAVQRIGDFTPLGAALQAVRDSWTGTTPNLLHLAVMAGYVVVTGLVAARFFRWE